LRCAATPLRYIPIAAGDVNADPASPAASFSVCAQRCRDTALCEFVVFDYITNSCQLRIGRTPIYVG